MSTQSATYGLLKRDNLGLCFLNKNIPPGKKCQKEDITRPIQHYYSYINIKIKILQIAPKPTTFTCKFCQKKSKYY